PRSEHHQLVAVDHRTAEALPQPLTRLAGAAAGHGPQLVAAEGGQPAGDHLAVRGREIDGHPGREGALDAGDPDGEQRPAAAAPGSRWTTPAPRVAKRSQTRRERRRPCCAGKNVPTSSPATASAKRSVEVISAAVPVAEASCAAESLVTIPPVPTFEPTEPMFTPVRRATSSTWPIRSAPGSRGGAV